MYITITYFIADQRIEIEHKIAEQSTHTKEKKWQKRAIEQANVISAVLCKVQTESNRNESVNFFQKKEIKMVA